MQKIFRTLCVLAIIMAGVFSAKSQDVITLKSGEEIKVKVEEISSSEIKYKRFDNLDGPTVVIEKAKVFAINYENGTREVINVITEEPTRVQETKETISALRDAAPTTFGLYANLGGFVFNGLMIGSEVTIDRRFVFDFGVGFLPGLCYAPISELDNAKGVMGIAGFKYFYELPKGGLYFGPFIGSYWEKGNWHWTDNITGAQWKDPDEFIGFLIFGNVGYKFTLKSGLFFRTGVYLGADFYSFTNGYRHVEFAYMLDLSIGFTFPRSKK